MLAISLEPVRIDPFQACTPQAAYRELAAAAQHYLREFDRLANSGQVPRGGAAITRVRGTGPGVSFGALLTALLDGTTLVWTCPFEGSENVSGAEIRGIDVLQDPARSDGFLVLRFAPGTRDLPLHVHPASDRFIFAIEGRGFFHVSAAPPNEFHDRAIRHAAVRDRDALMFRRGTVHTFSTAEHALTLLSYHQPFIELDDPGQYVLTQPPLSPATFLCDVRSHVSFDAWTRLL
jgi:hypothetical protein